MKTAANFAKRLREDRALRDAFLSDPIRVLAAEGYNFDRQVEEDLRRVLPSTAKDDCYGPATHSLGVISGSPISD
jgi:hypothetical protein